MVQPVAFIKASLKFSLQDIEKLNSELEEAKDEIDQLRSFL